MTYDEMVGQSSERPWCRSEETNSGHEVYHCGIEGGGYIVADISNDAGNGSDDLLARADANAELIVRAVNSFQALVEALGGVLKVGRGTSGRLILELSDEEPIRAALKLAKEGQ